MGRITSFVSGVFLLSFTIILFLNDAAVARPRLLGQGRVFGGPPFGRPLLNRPLLGGGMFYGRPQYFSPCGPGGCGQGMNFSPCGPGGCNVSSFQQGFNGGQVYREPQFDGGLNREHPYREPQYDGGLNRERTFGGPKSILPTPFPKHQGGTTPRPSDPQPTDTTEDTAPDSAPDVNDGPEKSKLDQPKPSDQKPGEAKPRDEKPKKEEIKLPDLKSAEEIAKWLAENVHSAKLIRKVIQEGVIDALTEFQATLLKSVSGDERDTSKTLALQNQLKEKLAELQKIWLKVSKKLGDMGVANSDPRLSKLSSSINEVLKAVGLKTSVAARDLNWGRGIDSATFSAELKDETARALGPLGGTKSVQFDGEIFYHNDTNSLVDIHRDGSVFMGTKVRGAFQQLSLESDKDKINAILAHRLINTVFGGAGHGKSAQEKIGYERLFEQARDIASGKAQKPSAEKSPQEKLKNTDADSSLDLSQIAEASPEEQKDINDNPGNWDSRCFSKGVCIYRGIDGPYKGKRVRTTKKPEPTITPPQKPDQTTQNQDSHVPKGKFSVDRNSGRLLRETNPGGYEEVTDSKDIEFFIHKLRAMKTQDPVYLKFLNKYDSKSDQKKPQAALEGVMDLAVFITACQKQGANCGYISNACYSAGCQRIKALLDNPQGGSSYRIGNGYVFVDNAGIRLTSPSRVSGNPNFL